MSIPTIYPSSLGLRVVAPCTCVCICVYVCVCYRRVHECVCLLHVHVCACCRSTVHQAAHVCLLEQTRCDGCENILTPPGKRVYCIHLSDTLHTSVRWECVLWQTRGAGCENPLTPLGRRVYASFWHPTHTCANGMRALAGEECRVWGYTYTTTPFWHPTHTCGMGPRALPAHWKYLIHVCEYVRYISKQV